MAISTEVKQNVRERLSALRKSNRNLVIKVKGTEAERKAAAVKGYKAWEDTRIRANNVKGSR